MSAMIIQAISAFLSFWQPAGLNRTLYHFLLNFSMLKFKQDVSNCFFSHSHLLEESFYILDIILTNGIAFQIYSEDLMSGSSPDWENFQSGLFSPDLSDVVMIGGGEGEGEEGPGPQLVRRKVTVSEEEDNQVSIVLTRGRVRPLQILSWDQHNDTM